ncbi:TonB-dependent receptor [Hymenobacter sp. BT175]|uniref:TonB-dependent receptor n=1 Tax=Hymenobacter translucens TaxID=2886507 RepID=UPI001D0EDF26|nr:TonB-dependent receptor [Hymenobacter translucens]MCC2545892.1 TonB-dependent receptor [Hymenobacter translucens]
MTHLYRSLLLSLLMLAAYLPAWAQAENVTVSGTVTTDTGEALPGATVFIKGTFIGTSTDRDGKFLLKADFSNPPVVLSVSFVGFETQEVSLTAPDNDVKVGMKISSNLTAEVIASASRIEESLLQAPVTVDKLTERQVEQITTPDLLSGLARVRGVDVSSSSLLTSSISTRGFNSSRSERVIQLADYMDTQLPSLSSNFGNLLGIPDLDVESIEIVHGPASALYGANAFNGVVLFNSKDPFVNEGLTVRLRGGNRNLFDGQIRYATRLGERFAFKISGGALTARDWIADNENPTDLLIEPNNHERTSNLGYDAVNRYGDVGFRYAPGLIAPGTPNALGGQTVFLPGYTETELIGSGSNQNTHIYKVQPSLSMLLTSNVKATVDYKWVNGSTIFQSASRYRFQNSGSHQGRAEVKGTNWFVRAYSTRDYSPDPSDDKTSYNLGFLGGFLQNTVVPGSTATYAQRYFQTYAQAYNQAFYAPGGNATSAAAAARAFANANAPQLKPGTPEFEAARTRILQDSRPGQGAVVQLRSILNDASAQYNFKFEFADVIVGAAYRQFRLGSEGSLFEDTPGGDRLLNHEYGGYAQITKTMLDNRLKLSVAGRVDEFKNFSPAFSPRASVVYSAGADKKQNFRASYSRAFRSPTQTDQYIRLDVGRALILGNIKNGYDGYKLAVLAGGSPADGNNLYHADKLRLEEVNTAEVGYRAVLGDNLFVDVDYFRSFYNDFIGTQTFVGKTDGTRPAPAELATTNAPGSTVRVLQISANIAQKVETQGASIGLSYRFGAPLTVAANYSYNEIFTGKLPEGFQTFFNTPKHKYNVALEGAMMKRLSYNVNYRWSDSFLYESTFARGQVAAYHTVDAQAGFAFPTLHTTLQAGVSNLFDAGNVQVYGSQGIGRLGYVGLLFELR